MLYILLLSKFSLILCNFVNHYAYGFGRVFGSCYGFGFWY
jgi:hypothetical protein